MAGALLARTGVACATTGAGTMTLGAALGAVAPNLCAFMDFPTAGAVDGKTYRYLILDSNGGWEIAKGVYTASGTTLARTTVKYSSNSNAAINLSGNAQVFISPIPDDLLSLTDDQTGQFTSSERAQGRVNLGAAMIAAMSALVLNHNAGFELSQESGTSALTLTGTGALQTKYLVDGVMAAYRGTFVATAQQSTDAPSSHFFSSKFTVGTAQASLGANDELSVVIPVEGYRSARLAFGGGAPNALAIWFWVKAHRTGNYSGSVRNGAKARSYPFSFTINSADTWEFKTVLISTGDTTGSWAQDNTVGLYLTVCIAGGSSRVGTANAWTASDLSGVTSTTNGVGATSDVFLITNVGSLPLVAGVTVGDIPLSTDTPFIVPPLDTALERSRRYFRRLINGSGLYFAMGQCSTTVDANFPTSLGPAMRAAPSAVYSAAGHFVVSGSGGAGITCTTVSSFSPTDRSILLTAQVAAGLVAGNGTMFISNSVSATLDLDARLT